MFTPPDQRAAVPPGALAIREQRLDDAVLLLDVGGTLDEETLGDLTERVDAALAGDVRWLVVDLAHAVSVADAALDALVAAARRLRARKGELIVAGAPAPAGQRLVERDAVNGPAQVASVDEVVMLLKRLGAPTSGRRPEPRARQRIAALTLPRLEPPA
jgi:anti-anti-sigma regulatory factor